MSEPVKNDGPNMPMTCQPITVAAAEYGCPQIPMASGVAVIKKLITPQPMVAPPRGVTKAKPSGTKKKRQKTPGERGKKAARAPPPPGKAPEGKAGARADPLKEKGGGGGGAPPADDPRGDRKRRQGLVRRER